MSKAVGYKRVSTQRQHEHGVSVDIQGEHAEQYYQMHLEHQGIEWAGVIEEPKGVSATKKPLHKRPGGEILLALLAPGDHIIIDRVDRLWRKNIDFAKVIEYFDENDIHLHVVNMMGATFDRHSPMGELILLMMVGMAQLEGHLMSSRVKDTWAMLRKQGKGCGQPPIGHMRVKSADKKLNGTFMIDPVKRSIMQRMVSLVDDHGTGFRDSVKIIHDEFPDYRTGKKSQPGLNILWHMYQLEKKLLAQGK